jgi:hypothetical protein
LHRDRLHQGTITAGDIIALVQKWCCSPLGLLLFSRLAALWLAGWQASP